MELVVAAADADPEMASQWLHEELDRMKREEDIDGQGLVLAALLDLCGDAVSEFVVETFYGKDWQSARYESIVRFVQELRRRKPVEWETTIRAIIAHEGFERMHPLGTIYLAILVETLEGMKLQDWENDGNRARKILRRHFGIPQMDHRSFVIQIESVSQPVLSTKLPVKAQTIELGPDGSVMVAIPRQGAPGLFSTADGKPLGSLATEGEVPAVYFDGPDRRLMTLNRSSLLQTWDTTTAKELSRMQSSALATNYHALFSQSGKFLITSVNEGYRVVDLQPSDPELKLHIPTQARGSSLFQLSADERVLALGFGKVIRFFDMSTGEPFATLEGHADVPRSGAFSPDGALYVSHANDNKVIFWDGETGALKREFVISWKFRHPDPVGK